MTAIDLFELLKDGGPLAGLCIVGWRLFQREKKLDEVNEETRKLAVEQSAVMARLSTQIEALRK